MKKLSFSKFYFLSLALIGCAVVCFNSMKSVAASETSSSYTLYDFKPDILRGYGQVDATLTVWKIGYIHTYSGTVGYHWNWQTTLEDKGNSIGYQASGLYQITNWAKFKSVGQKRYLEVKVVYDENAETFYDYHTIVTY